MTDSFFDRVDLAHERYKQRHKEERPFVDDTCNCLSCRSDMAGIAPCERTDNEHG